MVISTCHLLELSKYQFSEFKEEWVELELVI